MTETEATETTTQPSTVAESAASRPAREDSSVSRGAAIEAAVRGWVNTDLHNSPISRDAAALNHLTASLPNLLAALTAIS